MNVLALSLELAKNVLIPRTFFSHNRLEQFSKQNTDSSFIFDVITYYLSVKTSAIHFEVLEVS